MDVNGNFEWVFEPDDFKLLIKKYMGDEAESYYGRLFDFADEAISASNDKLRSHYKAFFDINKEIANISEVLDSKRMNRDKIAHSVCEIKKIISNQI